MLVLTYACVCLAFVLFMFACMFIYAANWFICLHFITTHHQVFYNMLSSLSLYLSLETKQNTHISVLLSLNILSVFFYFIFQVDGILTFSNLRVS